MADYLLIERALSGVVPIDKLNTKEREFCAKYRPVFEIGQMAGRMAQGYYAHKALIEVASDPRASSLASPLGDVTRRDGTKHVYDMRHYLDFGRTAIVDDLERIWLVGALIAIGDKLSDCCYLSHAPLLELIYHLRNGIAHGNKFTFYVGGSKPGLDRLRKYEAHNKEAQVKGAEFEIVPAVEGRAVLFDFMGPGDVLDLLQSVEVYFTRIRERRASGELLDDATLVVRSSRP
jgi:hypothetical protein